MKKIRNILSLALVFIMLIGLMPMNVFAEGEHAINITESEHGSVTANPNSAAAGATVTLTPNPEDGYELESLTAAGTTIGNITLNDKTFKMPGEDVTVTATFRKKADPEPTTHKITIAETTNGTVTSNPKDTAAAGATVTLTVNPADGYELNKLTVAGKTATNVTVTENKFKMPDEDVTVTATFRKKADPGTTPSKPATKEYSITVKTIGNGDASADVKISEAGKTITVTAKPYSGYAVARVYYEAASGYTKNINTYFNDYYYNDYNYYHSDYMRYYSDKYDTYEDYLYDRHYSFWKNNYRYYNRFYDRYDNYYYRYLNDFRRNYSHRYDTYEEYLRAEHYDHYYNYRYLDRYDYGYYRYGRYGYNTSDTFEMPASNITVYVEFTDWAYYDDYYYYRYYRNKKDNYYERQKKAEEKAKEEEEAKAKAEAAKQPQIYENKAVISIGSNILDKVSKNVHTVHEMDTPAYVNNGRVMLPLRFVAEALGLQVSWVPETKTVIIWDLTQRVEIPVKSNRIIVNGITYTSDVKPEIKSSRTMLPIANIARALGLIDGSDIIWDQYNKQVTLTRKVLSK